MVSVYCLAYNHEKYIRDALEGFVNQKTDFEYEVFVHDDASTDNTAQIILEYAEKYPNIIKPIIQKENQYSNGGAISQRFIFPQMKGKYIASCEGDDYWCDEYKLQKQVDFLEKNKNYVACVHNVWKLDVNSNRKEILYKQRVNRTVSMLHVIKWKNRGFQTASWLYRRELNDNPPKYLHSVNGIGDFPKVLWMRLNGKIYCYRQPMAVYRTNVEGSWSIRNKNWNKQKEAYLQIYNDFNKESNNKYILLVQPIMDRLLIELNYSYGKHEVLYEMGYLRIMLQGFFGVAISLFLQKHNAELYKKISDYLREKESK